LIAAIGDDCGNDRGVNRSDCTYGMGASGPQGEANRNSASLGQPSERQQRLPKLARLVRTADYRKVYSEGRRRNLGLLVAIARSTGEQPSRIGLTVPRAFGGAVDRNRIKRRLREVVRRHGAGLAPGWDIVFHPRTEAKEAKFADLEAVVREYFQSCSRAAGRLHKQ